MTGDEQIRLLWNAHRDGIKSNTDTAEKYFVDVLKLIISLSVGLLVFIVAVYDKILRGMAKIEVEILICSFILAILFSVITIVILAVHYKTYADNDYTELKNLNEHLKGNKIDKVKANIKKKDDSFWNQEDSGWQNSTIILGVISFALFNFGICFLMVCFLEQY